MRKIVCFGNSHTMALSQAVSLREYNKSILEIYWLKNKSKESERGDITEIEAIDIISNLGVNDIITISIIGTYHNIVGLLKHDTPFDFLLKDGDDIYASDDIAVIPYNAIRDEFDLIINSNQSIEKLIKAGSCPTYLLATPPPKEDNSFMAKCTKKYRGRPLNEALINDAHIRLRLWTLEMQRIEIWCQKIGAKWLFPPQQAITNNGYLKPEYYADDITHANARYGELVLQQIEAL
ncbi:hypothetical protein KFK14_14940 [Sphingobium phenoxybenzoativorans]|uniref:Uncharacterized protein n=1 Tax=Sphingobium phenoxybenzoativorans TaxID=1592790 RepID=A0A975Q044_9SPHN|nr:hypothetical protein [Sphingobium phenoxybenzoativorans]QUT04359.1 hypothetical protein KFK14_14940 [Sphingobium phenoxybenzoativorans]